MAGAGKGKIRMTEDESFFTEERKKRRRSKEGDRKGRKFWKWCGAWSGRQVTNETRGEKEESDERKKKKEGMFIVCRKWKKGCF